MASEHTVTIKFDHYGPSSTFVCTAPPESHCHAAYSCDCEVFGETGVEDGRPWHLQLGWPPENPVKHYGRFDPDECSFQNWFEETDDPLDGELSFDVSAKWEGDFYSFEIGEVRRGR